MYVCAYYMYACMHVYTLKDMCHKWMQDPIYYKIYARLYPAFHHICAYVSGAKKGS